MKRVGTGLLALFLWLLATEPVNERLLNSSFLDGAFGSDRPSGGFLRGQNPTVR
jgi:hypothetical protein